MSIPTEPSLTHEFVQLLPVLLGGALAILGGAGTQYLVHKFGVGRERKKILREKGESLVKALHAHSGWIREHVAVMVFENKEHATPDPLDEAWTIQQIYFPELEAKVSDALTSSTSLLDWIAKQKIARMKNQAEWLKTYDMSPFHEMFKIHLKHLYAAGEEAAEIVRKHLQS